MVPKDPNDTEPIGPPARNDEVTDPDPKAVAAYEPPTDNERIRFIFDNMETRRAPAPVDVPVTNGDFSASYSTTHPAPQRSLTPTDQPPVVVEADEPPATARTQGPARGRNDPTMRIVREGPPPSPLPAPFDAGATRRFVVVGSIVGSAALLLIVGIVVSLTGASSMPVPASPTTPPTNDTATVRSIPAPTVSSPPIVTASISTALPTPPAVTSVPREPPAAAPFPSSVPRAKVPAPGRPIAPRPQPSSDDFNLME